MFVSNNLRFFYNTVLSQTFSWDKKYLAAGNIYGDISIFEISKILGPQESQNENELQGPSFSHLVYPDHRIESMLATKYFLITGSTGELAAWNWKNLISSEISEAAPPWRLQTCEKNIDRFEIPCVTCMVTSNEDNIFFAACGNKIYTIDFENKRIINTFEGHTDYIHSMSLLNNSLASAAEDGSVRIWDLRKKEAIHILQPHICDKVARPRLGKWIGSVDFTDDWLLCGGGPKLSLWNTRTMEVCTIFDLPDQGIHTANIYDERIIAGGVMSHVYNMNYQGETIGKIPVSSNSVYSIAYQMSPTEIVSIAGSSNNIDICTNFNYREFAIKFA